MSAPPLLRSARTVTEQGFQIFSGREFFLTWVAGPRFAGTVPAEGPFVTRPRRLRREKDDERLTGRASPARTLGRRRMHDRPPRRRLPRPERGNRPLRP